jgi:hypothetical protein
VLNFAWYNFNRVHEAEVWLAFFGFGSANMMSSKDAEGESPRVESLANFPFRDFHEFRAAYAAGIISPFVSGSTASRWARVGVHSSRWLVVQAWALGFLPHLIFTAFVIYAAIRQPLLLLATPLILISYFLFNPLMFRVLRIFVWGPLVLVACTFTWALAEGKIGTVVVTGAVLVIWYSQRMLHKKAVRALGRAVTEHEDLLRSLWATGVVGVAYPNGDIFWADHKYQDGKDAHY